MKALQGKKIAFLGDSITEGAGASVPANGYVSVFGELTGATVYNFGVGGTRIAKQRTPTLAHPRYDEYFELRAREMPAELDMIAVFGGTNDFGHGDAPLGRFGDRTPDTFYGALFSLYTMLYEKYPQARIVAALPMHRLGEEEPAPRSPDHAAFADYLAAIRQTAAYFSVPVLDLYGLSNIQPALPVLRGKFMPDGLHPSDEGHRRIAALFADFLSAFC